MGKWKPLLDRNLSNAVFPKGVWTVTDGVLTASEDKMLWTRRDYSLFDLELEFKTADGTNSGVIIYVSDPADWVANSVEVQIADDFSEQWSKAEPTWQCGALFGHQAPRKSAVKKPGNWNSMRIEARGPRVKVWINAEQVIDADLRDWTSATTNPDGSSIPPWLSTPWAELPHSGRIGLQGKHAGAPIWFRNIRVREAK
ncbi:MAG: hypothetical protein SynsKO_45350 [Synoicihabitans sp.]